MRKKGVLLGLVEPMDLIHEQNGPLPLDRAPLLGELDDPPQFGKPARSSREGLELGLGMRGDQAREGGLAAAGRPPEDQGRERILLDGHPQRPTGGQNLLLSDHLIERPRPHAVCQRAGRTRFLRFGVRKQVHFSRIPEAWRVDKLGKAMLDEEARRGVLTSQTHTSSIYYEGGYCGCTRGSERDRSGRRRP